MKINKVKPSPCPYCGSTPNAASSLDNAPPKPGDITICSNCRNYLEFGENMELLKTTEENIVKVDEQKMVDMKTFIARYFNQ